MTEPIQWSQVKPDRKWEILRKQKRFCCWALYTAVGGMMLGFDYSVTATAVAFPDFQRRFGIPYPTQPSGYLIPAYVQSLWSASACIGMVIGSFLASQVLDIIGRKHNIAVGSTLARVGIVLEIVADNWEVFFGGKLINAVGFGMVFLTSPTWTGENVRPELREFFLCLTNGSIVFGQFICALAAYGTARIPNKWSYQILIILQFVYIAVLLCGYPSFPESSYYLVKAGNFAKARSALRRLHGSTDPDLIDAEIERLGAGMQDEEVVQDEKSPLAQFFRGNDLKRTLVSCLPVISQQLIGAAFVLGYVTYFMSLLGIENYFTVNVILFVFMLLSNTSAFFFIETVGRRTLLVPGMVIITGFLLLMGIMGCVKSSEAIWVILVCIFAWSIVYQLTIGAAGFALAAEVATLPLRPSTMSLVCFCQGGFGWLVGFVSPYMINPDAGNLGAKVGFVFGGIGVILSVLFYLYVPETKGLDFTELDYLFTEKTSCREFQEAIGVHRQGHQSA